MISRVYRIFIFFVFISFWNSFNAQTLIINEFSNGPAGAQEYIEFIVVDDNAFYDCGNSAPPCVDIRGWIIDDNSGYHGTGGVAAGCNRFSYDSFWQCIPIGTIITVYNNVERNISLPSSDDLSMSDNNCRLIIPINNTQLFDKNATTPGAIACSYPSSGWIAGGNWSYIGMANTGDCARLVNLAGCEVSSLCYGDVNLNTQVYFASGGSGADNVWSFSDGNSTLQANWSEGCADNETTLDAGNCGADNQTPGVANNALNSAFIAQFNNNCQPIQPLALSLTGTTPQNCSCNGTASISATGSIGPYTYAWYDNLNVPLGQTSATAINLCSGNYYCVVTSSIDCIDTIQVSVGLSNLAPTVEAGPNQTTCGGAGAITLNGLIGGSATGLLWSSPSGSFSSSNSASTTYTPSITSGVVTIILTATGPCPSIQDQLILLVNATPTVNAGTDQTICVGSTVNLSGAFGGSANSILWTAPSGSFSNATSTNPIYTPSITSGNVTLTLTASGPCPSVSDQVVINVIAPTTPTFTQIGPICSGGTISLPTTSLNGITGTWLPAINNTSTTTYTFTPTAGLCATTTTMIVVVNPTYSVNTSRTICPNQIPYLWNGVTFNGPGTQSATLSTINSCDSIVNMTLNVSSTITSTTNFTICNSDLPYSWNGLTFNSAGSQSVNLTAISGCDSIATLNLSIYSTPASSTNITVCQSQIPYSWNGLTFNGSGSQTATLQDLNGCDSLATLTLQVANTLSSSSSLSICPSELPFSWNGLNFTSAGSQTATLQSVGGCDSLATLTLSLFPTYNELESVTICSNETPFLWNGLSLSASTSQSVTLNSVNGCDSIVTLNLSVLPVFSTSLDSIICQNELPIVWNGLTFNAAGTQTLTFTSANGCDSSVNMNVQVLTLPQASITGGGVFCEGDVIQPVEVDLIGSSPFNVSYTLDGVGINISTNQTTVSLGNAAGTYILTGISDLNCQVNSNLGSASIIINPIPNSPQVSSDSTYCLNYIPDTLVAIGNLNATISWFTDATLSNPIQTGNSYYPNNILGTTTYYVAQEENGCLSEPNNLSITFENCDIIIPTAFTPDGDNVNDTWILGGIDEIFPKNNVYIYNRWGNVIFQSQQGKYETNSWDGKYDDKQMPVGSYYFIIEFNDDQTENKTGIVSIIK